MLKLCILCGILILIIFALLIKIILLKKAAKEIGEAFADKLSNETNSIITISSRDCQMRRLAAQINTQLRLLRAERHRFQSGDKELKEAVTNISHDLRTPLTAICGYLDLLKREDKSDEVSNYLAILENRSAVLTQLTEELFRYSIIMSRAEQALYEDVVLNSVLEESISVNYAALKSKGITPNISIPEQNVKRRLDRSGLSRILENVISNAIKYSDGDLSILLQDSGEIIFSNTARNLTAITVAQLFSRFFTVKTGQSSTGLGLSIARQLTEQMGGTIKADYIEGKLIITIKL